MPNQPAHEYDENMQKRIENLFEGEELPSYLTVQQVEGLKKRITELENKLSDSEHAEGREKPGDDVPAPMSEPDAVNVSSQPEPMESAPVSGSPYSRIRHISTKILLPSLMIFFLALALFFAYNFYTTQVDNNAREAADSRQSEDLFNSELDNLEKFALGLAMQSATNPDIQAAFATQDREELLDLTLESYKALDAEFDIPQYQFHLAPAVSFLRLHNVANYGDDLSSFRNTVLQVNETLEPVAGLEVGRGGMGMRGIMPMFYEGEHIGSVEFGLNIDDTFTNRLKEKYGSDWRIILTRDSLSLATLEDISELKEVPGSENLLVLASTIDGAFAPVDSYTNALNNQRTIARVEANELIYSITTLPLYNYKGDIIGAVEIITDRTAIVNQQVQRIFLMLAAMLVALVAGSLSLSRTTNLALNPLTELTLASEAIERGDLSRKVNIASQDEIGQLGHTFNRMTAQLQNLIGSLEQRVAERTHDLELAAVVGRTITEKVNSVDSMLSEAAEMIRSRFDLYYTQVYLVDPFENILRLRAGTGDVGHQLLSRGHRLRINLNSINGRAVSEKQAVVVSDTAEQPFFLPNDLLPDTRSEMAVPLILGGHVVGVLDMQSTVPNALNEFNLPAFEVLSGQLAVAIQNANLFEDAADARMDLEERARRQSYLDWSEFLNAVDRSERIGFAYKENKVQPISSEEANEFSIDAPLQVTGAEIGKIQISSDAGRIWSESELQIVKETAAQLSHHIDNLRLLAQADKFRKEAELAVKRLTREGWDQYLQIRQTLQSGFAYDQNQVLPLEEVSSGNGQPAYTHPITVRDELIGELETHEPHTMAPEEAESLIQQVAGRLSAHIENLRLTEQTEKALNETQSLYEIGRKLNQAITEDEILNALSATARNAGCSVAEIYYIDYEDEKPAATTNVANWYQQGEPIFPTGTQFNFSDVPTSRLLLGSPNSPLLIEDTHNDERVDEIMKMIWDSSFTRAVTIIPLTAGTEWLGFVAFSWTDPHQFSELEKAVYAAMIHLASPAVQSRRLFLQTEESRAKLQINEARLSEALDIARLANWEYDVEKDIFTFNDQFYSIFHTTAEKVGGYRLSSAQYAQLFVYPDDMPVVGMEIEKALNSKERFYNVSLEHRIIFADGGIGYISVNLNVERDEQGKITRYYGANQDITERKLAEELIRTNEARLSEALEIARLGNWEYNFEKDLFTFNDNFYAIFRTNVQEVGSYQISSAEYARRFVHPDDAALVGEEIGKAVTTTERFFNQKLEHRIIFADGSIGYISVNIHVERDENGKIVRWYGANQDITERKLAEEAIRTHEARLSEALEIARLGNWEYDFDKDLFTFNDNFYAIFRTNVQEVGSYQISSAEYARRFVHPDDAALVGEEIGKAVTTTERFFNQKVEHRIIFADGNIGYISVNIHVERDENGKIVRWYGANQDITERKLAELELEHLFTNVEQSQAMLRSIIDATPDWIFVKDKEHRYQLVNQGYANALHIPTEEFVGKNDLDLGFPEELVKGAPEKGIRGFWADDKLVLETNETQVFPDDPATIDGKIHTFHTIKTPLKDADGNPQSVLAFARDITERKQAEAETYRLAQAVQSTADMVVITDRNGNIQFANHAFERLTGYKVEEVLGGNPRLIKSGLQDADFYKNLWGEILAGRVWSGEITNRRKDGSLYEAQLSISPIFDNKGEITQFVAVQRDITQMKRDQQIIAERANQLETVATVSTTASTVLNPDALLQTVVDLTKERFSLYHAHIYLADEAWNTLLLSAGAGEVGRKMASAGHAIQMDAQRSLVARASRERHAVIVNDIHADVGFLPNPLLPDTHAEMAVPMIVGDKVLGVFDVQSENVGFFTEEDALIYNTLAAQVAVALQNARLYQEQSATLTQLRELDRLKSSFLANMSHELRTPLNSILGFTDVMLEGLDGSLTPYMQNDLSLIQKNGQHLLHLINDVLDMAKIESGKLNLVIEKFNLQEVVEEVISITSPLANEKKINIEIDMNSDHEVEVSADRTRLRQVLLNLVNNAAKFTDKGKIAIRALREANNVLISVRDTGIGIPPTHLESIFQEFTQVDSSTTRKAGGTGLGLPISRRLIQMHGGRLWAESSGIEGEGSTFYVFLPLEAKVAESEITSKR